MLGMAAAGGKEEGLAKLTGLMDAQEGGRLAERLETSFAHVFAKSPGFLFQVPCSRFPVPCSRFSKFHVPGFQNSRSQSSMFQVFKIPGPKIPGFQSSMIQVPKVQVFKVPCFRSQKSRFSKFQVPGPKIPCFQNSRFQVPKFQVLKVP